jgi:hypothetical protein
MDICDVHLQSADVPAYFALPVCIIITQLPLTAVSISTNVTKISISNKNKE